MINLPPSLQTRTAEPSGFCLLYWPYRQYLVNRHAVADDARYFPRKHVVNITIDFKDAIVTEQIINKQVDAFITSWNNHNFADMGNYTTEDCDWVNVVGMWWKGRK